MSLKTRGFTLVELLVVISIIGLFASVVLSAVNSARVKAENTNKIAAMQQYQKAILLAYDANGEYPDPGDTGIKCLGDQPDDTCGWSGATSESATLNGILDDFISLPILNPIVNSLGTTFEGAMYQCSSRTIAGECTAANIRWFTDPAGTCGNATQDILNNTLRRCYLTYP
ncbi:MAG: hypothetical protein A2408_00835 [Candidatus Yonathbacteria bacterium RIFOXYC1_FULL_52_10]|uniref:Type II secretion system protein GspG C-terminal domain-containing protein n=1 Tax=Candidatus Yonathbacteria bacterium RIFOXYD1_FULL_52_36 TaxID=1802730 RepID=A0A1G2SJB8_9BACT|nr:MAG: hypothetical protein A2591_04090 [Candidatus Yonathbacteria bacterium RIFOXYD1_FULL_52_36]OHA85690.1 MAG: hypothetical protein A2408_00835 [Candidatus Yonathbacteria bacterium RIFOXYC1_FULL_52_10]